MEEKVSFHNSQKEKIIGYLHIPDKTNNKGIVLAHCFTCSNHIKIIREICDSISKEGFLVLRFDFSGNGESEGKFEDATYSKEIKDLENAVSFLEY